MPDQKSEGDGGGVHLKIPKADVEISSSDASWSASIQGCERIFGDLERWAHENPWQFAGLLLLLGFAIYQRRIRMQNTAQMKLEFGRRRDQASQPELPLPTTEPDGTSQ